MAGKCPTCHAPAKHMPPDGDFRYDPPRRPRRPSRSDVLEEALRNLLAANEAVQNVLCDGPDVPGFDPTELGRAQAAVSDAEQFARRALKDRDG